MTNLISLTNSGPAKFAYVRYLDDNITSVVPISYVKNFREFDPIKKGKKYSVLWKRSSEDDDGNFYDAEIIYIAESEDKIHEAVGRRRIKYTKKSYIETDSQDSAASDSQHDVEGSSSLIQKEAGGKAKRKKVVVSSNRSGLSSSASHLRDIMEEKLKQIKSAHDSGAMPAKKMKTRNVLEEDNSRYNKDTNMQTALEIMSYPANNEQHNVMRNKGNSEWTENESQITEGLNNHSSKGDELPSSCRNNDQQDLSQNDPDLVVTLQEKPNSNRILQDKQDLENIVEMGSNSGSNNDQSSTANSKVSENQQNKNTPDLLKENRKLKREVKKLKQENSELSIFNRELQRKVIHNVSELLHKLNYTDEGPSTNLYPEIGKTTKNNTHLGQGIWLPNHQVTSIMASYGKLADTSKFIMNLTTAVFGTETLKRSSVTGRKCNAKKDSVAKEPLDPRKLLAIREFFAMHLKTKHKLNQVQIDAYCAKITGYINSKIYELNRVKKDPRNSLALVVDEVPQDDAEISEEESNVSQSEENYSSEEED